MNTPCQNLPWSPPAALRAPVSCIPLIAHDGDEPHFHEWSEEAKSQLAETIWKADNIELTTVGIDIGSSTSHLMFAKVHLQRKSQLLSSQFVVVNREVLWRSPILLTPFRADFTIDADCLRAFVEDAYVTAGLGHSDVDTGAVILTGEAIKRKNAEAIAQIFAAEAGKFVCASAGHHMECVLAAHGAGATAISRHTHRTVLNVDIGGGTTKLALIKNGEIIGTSSTAVGGRLIARGEDGRLTRIEDSARHVARSIGLDLRLGERLPASDEIRLANAMVEVIVSAMRLQPPEGLGKDLLLTDPLPQRETPHLITLSGGVSEYIFGRESKDFGDIARPIAAGIQRTFSNGRIPGKLMDPGEGIRATVIGASQFSVQVSGQTIHLTNRAALPLRNVPVVFPTLNLHREFDANAVTTAILSAIERFCTDESQQVAIGIRWHGDPHHHRLHALAKGIAESLGSRASRLPLVLMTDGDIGKLLGHLLQHELSVDRDIVSIDSIQLQEFDYLDIGEVIMPANVVPVVIKSLLFSRQ